jgi:hypothetical protein
MALILFAIVIAILVSNMKFFSVITLNAYNGFIQDFFLRHFPCSNCTPRETPKAVKDPGKDLSNILEGGF